MFKEMDTRARAVGKAWWGGRTPHTHSVFWDSHGSPGVSHAVRFSLSPVQPPGAVEALQGGPEAGRAEQGPPGLALLGEGPLVPGGGPDGGVARPAVGRLFESPSP